MRPHHRLVVPLALVVPWSVGPSAQSFTRVLSGDLVNDGNWSRGGAWADCDGDGDVDLFVPNTSGGATGNNGLYRNDGFGAFTQDLGNLVAIDGGESYGATWGDIDNDGDLDLFVANSDEDNFLYLNDGGCSFTRRTSGDVVNDGDLGYNPAWADYDGDGHIDLFVGNGPNGADNALYRNDGDGTFTEVTTGDIVSDGGSSYGAAWADYDHDGDPDLFVANTESTDFFYRNEGDGTFTRITDLEITANANSAGGASWGDTDNDGDLDLFVTNVVGSNFLYTNDGDGTFTRVDSGEIVTDGGSSWGSAFADTDNDGDLDLFVANSGSDNFLYSNDGDGTFTRIVTGDVVNDAGGSIGASWADVDRDGDLDLFVANRGTENNFFYLNDGTGNAYVSLELVGTESNAAALGARVVATATIDGTPVTQTREVRGQDGHGQNSLDVELGLGDATILDQLTVEWPSGIVQTLIGQGISRFLTITERQTPTTLALDCGGISVCPNGVFGYHAVASNGTGESVTLAVRVVAGTGIPADATIFAVDVPGESMEVVRHIRAPGLFPTVCPTTLSVEAALVDDLGATLVSDGCTVEFLTPTP